MSEKKGAAPKKKRTAACLICEFPEAEHGPRGKVAANFWSHRKFISGARP